MKNRLFALKFILFTMVGILSAGSLVSCSESDGEEEEYANWQSRNEEYWNSLYTSTQQRIASGDSQWRIYPLWSLTDSTATKPENHIVVQVLESGSGTESPISTDTTVIHYSGRLIPSASYPNGYNFQNSWSGNFSETTALPIKMVANGAVDGFCTALQLMHKGDHWRVYIPYQAAYKTTESPTGTIPIYSNLIFDIRLVDFYHPGEYYPIIR